MHGNPVTQSDIDAVKSRMSTKSWGRGHNTRNLQEIAEDLGCTLGRVNYIYYAYIKDKPQTLQEAVQAFSEANISVTNGALFLGDAVLKGDFEVTLR